MTNEQLKKLEDDLWDSANSLRAYGGIKASEYAVLGLIFLRFAENKYRQHEPEIQRIYEAQQGTRAEQPIEKIALATCGFYLPPQARYDALLARPGNKLAAAIKEAMEAVEEYRDEPAFKDVLPKDAYFDTERKKDDILPELLKKFSDIPEDASSDVFGKIYEYFLGKFALSEGQKGGEFFTPTSVVRFIVEVIEPYAGKIYDPACGSGGMFVQSAKFVQEATDHDLNDIYVCGQEFMGETVRLAKMNLLVNNLRGEVVEVNSYEADHYKSLGKFDYVMANPPFNVKSIKESTVKDDPRFYTYGLPKGKGKKEDKISDANYLWISLFATSLNERGRAGFVMANSASDARHAEYDIRKKIVDSGMVDCMFTMPSNMFFTVTLPATLWFLDKGKVSTDRRDKILFLDARQVFRQIDRAHREWTDEQVQNLSAIVRLYRGETDRYLDLIANYLANGQQALTELPAALNGYTSALDTVVANLDTYYQLNSLKLTAAQQKKLAAAQWASRLAQRKNTPKPSSPDTQTVAEFPAHENRNNDEQRTGTEALAEVLSAYDGLAEELKAQQQAVHALWQEADQYLKVKKDRVASHRGWNDLFLNRALKDLETAQQDFQQALEQVRYWQEQLHWLQSRFPDATYTNITGLCRAANREEYAEEQDYSLNAGRYVGVEIEDDKITEEEFRDLFRQKYNQLSELNFEATSLETLIEENAKELLH